LSDWLNKDCQSEPVEDLRVEALCTMLRRAQHDTLFNYAIGYKKQKDFRSF